MTATLDNIDSMRADYWLFMVVHVSIVRGLGLMMVVVVVVSCLVVVEMVVGVGTGITWLVNVGAVEGVVVVQLSVSTGEDTGACRNNFWRKSELLTVKNQSLPVIINIVLRVLALALKTVNQSPSCRKVFDEILHVGVGFLVVKTDLVLLVSDALRQSVDVVRKRGDAILESLEGNE